MPDDPGKPDKHKRLSPEDARLWDKITAGIKPLPRHPGTLSRAAQETKKHNSGPDKTLEIKAQGRGPSEYAPRFELKDRAAQPEISAKRAPDRRTAEKLKRGQMQIEAVLDLHGLRQHEARDHLQRFLGDSFRSGKRCVLIITGKGSIMQGGDRGVLRRMFPVWLSELPLSEIVLQHAQAKPKDGGAGAFYVLLRRPK